jgi:hypothetical protein
LCATGWNIKNKNKKKEFFVLSDAFFFAGIYFGHSSMHDLPTGKASLHKFLRDGNVTFRIYCRPLHQRTPMQVGEAHLRMTDILKSEILSFCKDVEVVYRTKTPDRQVVIGLLKVTVKLGARWKQFGGDFPDRLNKVSLSSDTCNSCESRKCESEASLRHMSNPTPAPTCDGFKISRGIFNNGRKNVMSCDVNKKQELCKNDQQKTELDNGVVYSSQRELCVNKVRQALRRIELLSHFVIQTRFLVL